MLQEVKDLQDNAVSRLVEKVAKKEETTFRAPTGSGKTRMMADMMNRIIEANENIIFLVSSLSKGDLAKRIHVCLTLRHSMTNKNDWQLLLGYGVYDLTL